MEFFQNHFSETLLAKHFDGPAMFIAAAEETQGNLVGGRGDAYCGMLNASYKTGNMWPLRENAGRLSRPS